MPLPLGIVGLGSVAQLVYEPILARRRDLFEIVGVAEPGTAGAAGTAETTDAAEPVGAAGSPRQ
jgi:predicted dehydrogenase